MIPMQALLLAALMAGSCEGFAPHTLTMMPWNPAPNGGPALVCQAPIRRPAALGITMEAGSLGRAGGGVLERERVREEEPGGGRQQTCTNAGCTSNHEESERFYTIDASQRAGGQNWSALKGHVLCSTCYNRYRGRGTLESFQTLGGRERRCTYAACENPDDSKRYYLIAAESTAGSKDWAPLAGRVLCDACYRQYCRCGTLERGRYRLRAEYEGRGRRCTYQKCESPEDSQQYYRVTGATKAAGRDWSELEGEELCSACYQQYKLRGTLERDRLRPVAVGAEQCTWEKCENPGDSYQFYRILACTSAGGQDWSPLAGHTLCNACYKQYRSKATLERYTVLKESDKRCTYEGCKRPAESSKFYRVHAGYTAGGRDWGAIEGHVLCNACYRHYIRHGGLARHEAPRLESVAA